MTKYNAKSAEVLNAADNFEMKLNWTLFTAEQDQRLWGDCDDVYWKPGKNLYSHPTIRSVPEELEDDAEEYERFFLGSSGFWGNHPRPMIQIIEDNWEYDHLVRCDTCAVGWVGNEINCWMCGKPERESRLSLIPDRVLDWSEPIGHVERVERTMQGINVRFVINDEALQVEWARVTEAMQHMSVQATVSAEYLRELFGLFDETIPERFLVSGIEIPEDWNSISPEIPLPEMPEPRDFTNWCSRTSGPERPMRDR